MCPSNNKDDSTLSQPSGEHDLRMENYYRLLAEKSREIVIAQNIDRRVIHVNSNWVDITGYSLDETIGQLATNFIAPECRQKADERNHLRRTGSDELYIYDVELLGKNGERIPVEVRSSPAKIENGEVQEILLVARDIRERRKVERALIESENRYRSLFESAPIAIWEEDFSDAKKYLDELKATGIDDFEIYLAENLSIVKKCIQLTKTLKVNESASRFQQQVTEKSASTAELSDILQEPTVLTFKDGLVTLLSGETAYFADAVTNLPDGDKIYQAVQWKVLPGYEESWARIIVSSQDISEQKKSQHLLERSESSYRDLFNTIEDAIYIQNKDGRFVDINQGAETLYGIPKEDIIGKMPDFLSAPGKNDLAEVQRKFKSAFSGEPQEFEFYGKRGDGTTFPKEVRLYKGSYFGEEVVIALAREVTQRKEAEAKLQQQLSELNLLQATAFACAQATNEDMLIRQITNILGNTLDPDVYGILLHNPEKKTLALHFSHSPIDKSSFNETGELDISQGITGRTVTSGKSCLVMDTHKDPDYIIFTPATQSELCVPIKVNEHIIGVINLESAKKAYFNEAHERLLNTIAGQMSVAIENLHLLKTEQQRRQIAETLQKTAAVLTQTLNSEKATDLILEELASVVPFESASVQLLRGDYLEIIGGRGSLVLETEKGRRFPFPGDNPNTTVIRTGQPLNLGNAPKAYAGFLEMPTIKSWLGVPLIAHDQPIGLLTLDSSEFDHFTEEDIRLTSSLAHHAAITIENAHLFEAERKRREEAETLRETALTVTASLSLDQAIQHILEQLARVLPYDSASIQILTDGIVENIGGRGWLDPEEVIKMRLPIPGDNPNTTVLQEKRVVILDDAPREHAPFRLPPHNYIHSWMGIPLIFRDKVIGMLAVDSKEKGYFTKESEEIAQVFAYQAAIAIENARLYNAEQTRRQEAETLRQAAHTISSSLNLQEVLDTILASIKRVIPYDSAAVMLLSGDTVEITSGINLPDLKEQIGKTFSLDDTLLVEIVETAHPVILADAQSSPHFKQWGGTDYVHGWMGIPLIVRGKVIGYITVDSRTVGAYQKKHAELAQTFAHQAASAIENARLYQDALETAERRAVLHRLSQDILRGIQSPEQTYKAIHHAAEELMRCDAFIISLREQDQAEDESVYLVDLGKRYSATKIKKAASIITLVEEAKDSFIIEDLQVHAYQQKSKHFGSKKKVRSLLVSPMYVGSKLIGAISAQSYTPDVYAAEEKVLLEMLASHAAAAIENARLFQETERRGKEFAELYEVVQGLVNPQDLDLLLTTILQRTTDLLGASCGSVYLYDEDNEELILNAIYGLQEDYKQKIQYARLKKNKGMAGKVAENLQPMRIDDYQTWSEKSESYEGIPFTSVLEVPMIYNGKLIGVLALYEVHPHTRYFTDNDERIMTLLATQLAGAVHSAKQFEEITDRLREFEAISQISASLRTTESPDEMLPMLLHEISRSLNISVSTIWLSDPNSDEAYKALASGWAQDISPQRQKDTEGIIGHIYTEGNFYISPNIKTDPYIKSSDRENIPDNWTGAWTPIRSTHAIIGIIGIMAAAPRKFRKTDIQLLGILAEITGNAIHRAKLHSHTEQQVKRLTALRSIDTAISSIFDLKATLRLIIEHTIAQLKIDAVGILLTTKPTKNLKYFIGDGFKTEGFSKSDLRFDSGLPGKTLRNGDDQHVLHPATHEDSLRKKQFAEEAFRSYYCVPLIAKGDTLGVLEIFHRDIFTPSTEWVDFLQTLAGQAAIAIENNRLIKDLKNSNEELALAYDTTLAGWGKALELRDKETQGHTLNVTELTLNIARKMGVSENDLIHIYRGALLHDIGKMGIPDNILRKPGPLTKDEWKIMRQHPQFASEMLSSIAYLAPAADIPYCHHERWDGSGYPRGLKGEEIPLAARIFSIVDVWDALLTNRPYREAWAREVVLAYIKNESGSRFDPKIVETFIKIIDEE